MKVLPLTGNSMAMRKHIFLLLFLVLALSGCDFVGDVIEFSFWTALIIIALFVLVIWLVVRAFRNPSRRRRL